MSLLLHDNFNSIEILSRWTKLPSVYVLDPFFLHPLLSPSVTLYLNVTISRLYTMHLQSVQTVLIRQITILKYALHSR